jgi:tetratricopeptide (TPR) repeat protein
VPPHSARAQHRLVGREDELVTLLDLVRGATAGTDPSALVLGDPGVGKSALVEELAARAGLPVLWGRSPDHGAVPPLWPWEQVLRGLASLRPEVEAPAEVRALIEGTLVTPEAGESDGARLRFYDAVVGHLAAAGPLLVVLEDLHAADAPTLRLLEHAVAARVPGLAVVGTARSHEASAMSSTMSRLAHLGTRRVELGGLGVDDVHRLLADLGCETGPGGPDAPDVLARTGGNPFLVTQVALSGTEVLDAAERAGLVRASGSGAGALTVRFAHSLLVDALLARRSSAWQALAHERCAVALTRVFGDRDDRHAAIARHWVAAAELGPAQAAAAAEFCARAARAAMNRRAAEAAVPLWQEAVAADAVAGGDPGTSFELLLGLADAAHAAGLLGDAQEVVTRALALAEERHDAEQVVRAMDAYAGRGVWIPFQEAEEAQRLVDRLESALDRLPPDSPAQVLGRGVRMMLWGAIGDEEAIAADLRALHAESHALDPDLSRRVAYHAVVACRGPGLIEERGLAAQWLRGLVSEHTALGVVADLQAMTYAAEQGDLDHARRVVDDLERRTAELRDPTLARQVLSARIGLMINDGLYDEAWQRLDEAAAAPTPLAEFFTIDEWGQRAHLRWEQQRLHELADAMDYGLQVLGVTGFAYARGLAHLEVGEPGPARELLAVPLPRRDYTRASATVARAALAVALGDREVLEDSRRVLTPYSGRLVVTGQLSGVYGAYDGILGEVCLALGDTDAARRHLAAALELLEPGGNVRWTARARAALDACS